MPDPPEDATRTDAEADGEKTLSSPSDWSVNPPASRELEPGDDIGGYAIEVRCGQGGFGSVYRARAPDGSTVAVKLLHAFLARDDRAAARFRREAEAIRRIGHANVVRVLGAGVTDDRLPFLVMEWLPGVTLKAEIERRGALTPAEALAIVESLGHGLAAAHAAGVVHRDLKPSNVMLVPRGERVDAVLLDFGIAKLFEPDTGTPLQFTSAAVTLGSPQTMAPEQIRAGTIGPRTDIYALGIVLFVLVTGGYPFSSDSWADLKAMHMEGRPPPASSRAPVSPAIDAVIQRCLEKRPDDRYGSVDELVDALRAAVAAVPGEEASSRDAVGVLVELRLGDGAEDADDDLLDLADDVLDRLRAQLEEAGLTIAVNLGSGFLAVNLLPRAPAAARARRIDLLGLLVRLDEEARIALPADAPFRFSVRMHRDAVETSTDGAVAGGPLLQLGSWAAAGSSRSVVVSAAALEDLSGDLERAGELETIETGPGAHRLVRRTRG